MKEKHSPTCVPLEILLLYVLNTFSLLLDIFIFFFHLMIKYMVVMNVKVNFARN